MALALLSKTLALLSLALPLYLVAFQFPVSISHPLKIPTSTGYWVLNSHGSNSKQHSYPCSQDQPTDQVTLPWPSNYSLPKKGGTAILTKDPQQAWIQDSVVQDQDQDPDRQDQDQDQDSDAQNQDQAQGQIKHDIAIAWHQYNVCLLYTSDAADE